MYAVAHLTWYFMDVHKRLGPWGVSEPKSHLIFALKSSWIVALFGLGNDFVEKLFHINAAKVAKFADFELSDSYHIFSSDNLGKDIAVAMVVFYTVDFLRYLPAALTSDVLDSCCPGTGLTALATGLSSTIHFHSATGTITISSSSIQ